MGGSPADPSDQLAALIGGSRLVAVFTGAGISTECGVPDFRSPGSPWLQNSPVDFRSFVTDPVLRAEAWRRKFAMDDVYAGATPGRGHHAIVRLEHAGKLAAVITQNIDGLHGAAGLSPAKLIELHGNGTFARCLSCNKRHELAPIRERFELRGELPVCACGGLVKSASVAFGQPLSRESLERACDAALGCDLFLVLGSSLVVQPAARLPVVAKQAGARLVIVNRDPTTLDGLADLVVRADIGDMLGDMRFDKAQP